jgi:hypothetical protein
MIKNILSDRERSLLTISVWLTLLFACSCSPYKELEPQDKRKLLEEYQNSSGSVRLAAFRALYCDKSTWGDLIEVLQRNGDPELAEEFIDVSLRENERFFTITDTKFIPLRYAGLEWAERHGYVVSFLTKNGVSVEANLRK